MIFRQFFEPVSSTYTYLLGCEYSGNAILIDTVASQTDFYIQQLDELDLDLIYTAETHVHADHITAAAILRERIGSKSIVHRDAGALCADLLVTDGVILQVGEIIIKVLHTPGHTNGCVSYLLDDRVFTGDCLLINGCGRTDFQQGDAKTMYESITQKLFTLPDDTLVYPGHDYKGMTVSTIKQEKALNSRLGNQKSREEFIEIMNNLNLPYPKFINEALPANQSCGQVEADDGQIVQG
ncbi:MBL fold metallo-hydrolase [methane-oxidizing endosymbiont of Gigantopelta aegis]|uniref:MBL fold metallo-hydrolase n=1 Tax=methane-oxidizing endosymbiont of Gigantopelta aegis TaxID=2794938 RepID=UPI0018DCB4CD|nr:MBL fold metallo-hydrolase [methane-oxidizing endosymbiont of Gigantopelta aegis]